MSLQLLAFGYVLVVLALAVYALHGGVLLFLSLRTGAESKCEQTLRKTPKVTVQIPVYNERYVVERVIRAAASLALFCAMLTWANRDMRALPRSGSSLCLDRLAHRRGCRF